MTLYKYAYYYYYYYYYVNHEFTIAVIFALCRDFCQMPWFFVMAVINDYHQNMYNFNFQMVNFV